MNIKYGTSSWSEKSWGGVFYPAGLKHSDFLNFYATQFKCVEADVTYYRIPSAKMVQSWYFKTPDDFKICAKFPRSIVHAGQDRIPDGEQVLNLQKVQAEVDAFLSVLQFLKHKCGPLVIQLPYFNRTVFRSNEDFLERLSSFLNGLPKDFRYALEIRNKNFLTPDFFQLLKSCNTCLVLADLLYMPRPWELPSSYPLITSDFSYIRLIGDRKSLDKLTNTFDKIVIDKKPLLLKWATFVSQQANSLDEIYIFANNHFAGHGPATIRQLMDILQDLKVK